MTKTKNPKVNGYASAALFARNFFRYPSMLGAFIPSSRFLVEDVLSQIDWSRVRLIVEYGPGVGTMTRRILQRMPGDAVLAAIELNDDFVSYLQNGIRDPRLRVIQGSAAHAEELLRQQGLSGADYVISGIPYSVLPKRVRNNICEQTRRILREDGAHLVYQFTSAVLPYLRSNFSSVEEEYQILNILPARIYHCTL